MGDAFASSLTGVAIDFFNDSTTAAGVATTLFDLLETPLVDVFATADSVSGPAMFDDGGGGMTVAMPWTLAIPPATMGEPGFNSATLFADAGGEALIVPEPVGAVTLTFVSLALISTRPTRPARRV